MGLQTLRKADLSDGTLSLSLKTRLTEQVLAYAEEVYQLLHGQELAKAEMFVSPSYV